MYMENPREEIKNHGLSKNRMFLPCSDCIMYEKRSHLYNKGVLAFYHLKFLLFSLEYLFFGFSPKTTIACPSYNLNNMVEYIDRCQVIIFLFWTFHSCEVIYWLEDRNCANMALGPVGRWLCHYLGNKFLDIERDIRSTVIDTRVSEVVQHAFNQ